MGGRQAFQPALLPLKRRAEARRQPRKADPTSYRNHFVQEST
jgi:hypothetical protein